MKVQKASLPDSGLVSWMVLDDNYLPILPIHRYIRYLESLSRSPNTLQSYARNLKLYWEFLQDNYLDWQQVRMEQLSEFIHWLRNAANSTAERKPQECKRSENTINHVLTTIYSFYEFHEQIGSIKGFNAYDYQVQPRRKYKSFLHHISKGKDVKTKRILLKEPKTFPGCLTQDEVRKLIDNCNRIRDKFQYGA